MLTYAIELILQLQREQPLVVAELAAILADLETKDVRFALEAIAAERMVNA